MAQEADHVDGVPRVMKGVRPLEFICCQTVPEFFLLLVGLIRRERERETFITKLGKGQKR